MHDVYISAGSNSADAAQKLAQAQAALAGLEGVRIAAISPVYLTEPQDYAEQPWFHNQAAHLRVADMWRPRPLLAAMLAIEAQLGRQRGAIRFGPRAIDLDILLYDNLVLTDADCLVPHPRLRRRAFALLPLLDIAPDLAFNGKTVRQWLADLNWRLEGRRIFQAPA